MKACHPDLSGDDPETTNFCKFINEVYGVCFPKRVILFLHDIRFWSHKICIKLGCVQVLSDPVQRMVYDEIHGYSLTAVNPFMDDSSPRDHVFVDEFSCIGVFVVNIIATLLW